MSVRPSSYVVSGIEDNFDQISHGNFFIVNWVRIIYYIHPIKAALVRMCGSARMTAFALNTKLFERGSAALTTSLAGSKTVAFEYLTYLMLSF
jgi:hypothetical protein